MDRRDAFCGQVAHRQRVAVDCVLSLHPPGTRAGGSKPVLAEKAPGGALEP